MIQRNIKYSDTSKRNLLDVVYDPNASGLPVILFIHGGSWMTGSKDLYTKLGKNFYARGFVTVIISYRLYPNTDVYGMVEDCRAALTWCIDHIEEYGGSKEQIFLMGHSAGGHLAAATGLRQEEPKRNIAGFILIDAFGLSAYHFLSVHGVMVPEFFAGIFGKIDSKWHLAAPDKMVRENLPPFLMLSGGETYPFLAYDNDNFARLLRSKNNHCDHKIVPGRSHMQMIYEYDSVESKTFTDTVLWMQRQLVHLVPKTK
jgi:acetyl esterase/lipase